MAVGCNDCPDNPLGDDTPCTCVRAVEDDNVLFGLYRSYDCQYLCTIDGIPRQAHMERRHELLWGLFDW